MADEIPNPSTNAPIAINGVHRIPISKINGLHHHMLKLMEAGGIAPYSYVSSDDFPQDVLLSVIELCPIVCRNVRGRLLCVGNTRIYQLALKCFDPEQPVPVTVLSGKQLLQIDKLYWAENFILPIMTDMGRSRYTWLHGLWQYYHASLKKLWKRGALNSIESKKDFARLLNIDPRTLK